MSNPIEKWYSFYPADYRRSTMFFTDEQDLLYRRMLDLYWETLGNLPANNEKVIAKQLQYSVRKFERVWKVVGAKFPVKNGKLTNPRMDYEIAKALNNHKAAVENGKKGGRPKKNPEVSVSFKPNESESKALYGDGGVDGPFQGKTNQLSSTTGQVFEIDDFTGEVIGR